MDSNKALSITRTFIRYAVSSILYHTLLPRQIYNEEAVTVNDGNVKPTTKIDTNNLDHCFVDKTFCGMNLKFIGVVENDDTIKNENRMLHLKLIVILWY